MKAIIDPEKCKECGLCMESCPAKAISMSDDINSRGYKHIALDCGKCVGCGVCYTVCPDGVFSIVEVK